jgi:integrase/recombinase XerD
MMSYLERYRVQLENNPKFQYGTINAYCKAIADLIDESGEYPAIEQLNSFIAKKCQKGQPYVKYAIKEYLMLQHREEEYYKLVKAKEKKPIRPKVFLSKIQLSKIIGNIKDEPYKTMAKLQAATAARAHGIITLDRKRIRKESNRIRITLHEKGDKPTVIYLMPEYWKLLEPFYNLNRQFLFLEKDAEIYTLRQLTQRIDTVYKRYLEQLQAAAKESNIKISTHDIRRSVANLTRISTGDSRIVQKILGHESIDTTEKYLADNSEQVADAILSHQKDLKF